MGSTTSSIRMVRTLSYWSRTLLRSFPILTLSTTLCATFCSDGQVRRSDSGLKVLQRTRIRRERFSLAFRPRRCAWSLCGVRSDLMSELSEPEQAEEVEPKGRIVPIPTRIQILTVLSLWLVGCQSALISMPNIYNQSINSNLSRDKSREAIEFGAISAGWAVDNVSDGQVIATYRIRSHSAIVSIGYSSDGYGIFYKNSYNMKVKCGTRPASGSHTISSGQSGCPDGTVPTHIHHNYKLWVDRLNNSIQAALQSACYSDAACR